MVYAFPLMLQLKSVFSNHSKVKTVLEFIQAKALSAFKRTLILSISAEFYHWETDANEFHC